MRLIRLLSYYKKKNKALAKKVQRLQKLLKISRRTNEAYLVSVETNAEPSDAQSNTCDVAADDINQPETSSRPKAVPVIEAIKNFYLLDVNSVLCAGKKQQITRNKKKMQKRLLCLQSVIVCVTMLQLCGALNTIDRGVVYSELFYRHYPFFVRLSNFAIQK